ncbi:MAG: hypothetical protein AAB975_03700 [Patescibacteria group bacterium]
MDDKKSPKRKADGIRKHTDSVRPQSAVPKYVVSKIPEKIIPQKKEISAVLPEKPSFLEQSGSSIISLKNSGVSQDASFKPEIFPRRPSLLRHKNVLAICVGLGITFVTALFLSTVFARVTVTIKPVVESLQIQDTEIFFNASASEVNATTRTVPAEFLSFEGSISEDFDATGSDYVSQKAGGRVRIYNAFNVSPQALVATTRFMTDSGILFRLPKGITIPSAKKDAAGSIIPQFIETDLIADKPGEGSNIEGEVKLRIPGFKGNPKYDGFYAVAQTGFSGGSIGQGRVITRDDLTTAQEKVSKKIFDDLKGSMVQKIPSPFRLVDSLAEIAIKTIDAPKEKTKTDRFTVTAKAVARVFVFRDADVIKLLNELLLKADSTKAFIDASADFRYQIKNVNYDKKIAGIAMNGAIKTKKIVSVEDITNLIAGKKEGSLIDALNKRRDIGTFRVAFFPPWIFSAPTNSRQIHVIIEDVGVDAKPK